MGKKMITGQTFPATERSDGMTTLGTQPDIKTSGFSGQVCECPWPRRESVLNKIWQMSALRTSDPNLIIVQKDLRPDFLPKVNQQKYWAKVVNAHIQHIRFLSLYYFFKIHFQFKNGSTSWKQNRKLVDPKNMRHSNTIVWFRPRQNVATGLQVLIESLPRKQSQLQIFFFSSPFPLCKWHAEGFQFSIRLFSAPLIPVQGSAVNHRVETRRLTLAFARSQKSGRWTTIPVPDSVSNTTLEFKEFSCLAIAGRWANLYE